MTEAKQETFIIVRNHEDQHALWQTHLALPHGWEDVGFSGTKEQCLQHVQRVWPDITPKSARLAKDVGDQVISKSQPFAEDL